MQQICNKYAKNKTQYAKYAKNMQKYGKNKTQYEKCAAGKKHAKICKKTCKKSAKMCKNVPKNTDYMGSRFCIYMNRRLC